MPTSAKLEDQQLRFYPSARCGVRDHPKIGIILNSKVCFIPRFRGHPRRRKPCTLCGSRVGSGGGEESNQARRAGSPPGVWRKPRLSKDPPWRKPPRFCGARVGYGPPMASKPRCGAMVGKTMPQKLSEPRSGERIFAWTYHRKISFQEELMISLQVQDIEWDDRYIWYIWT